MTQKEQYFNDLLAAHSALVRSEDAHRDGKVRKVEEAIMKHLGLSDEKK